MSHLSRRDAIKLTIGGAALGAIASEPWWIKWTRSTGKLSSSELNAMQRIAVAFMNRFNVPGLAIAIAHEGKLVLDVAFGRASHETNSPVSPSSLFRIASVSKPITSAGIFTLIEKGKLSLDDPVFGPGAILGTDFGTQPYMPEVQEIRVDHLLTHTAGGWPNDETDPMFRFPELSQAELITWTLDHLPLDHTPGVHYAYSNFGYCVLGQIIEKVTRTKYDEYIQREVLYPSGVTDMRIAGNTLDDRASDEVTYYGQDGDRDPYSMNVTRMDSNGGWLATVADLVHFVNGMCGTGGQHGFLRPDSVVTMTTPSDAASPSSDVRYARGWNVRNNGQGNWWHMGSLPGTTAILVRTPTGFSWAALINTRLNPPDGINLALDQMMWDIVRTVKGWKP